MPTPCIHSPDGVRLCDACLRDYLEDETAWEEFGSHPAGLANLAALDAEIAAARAAEEPVAAPDDSIPL